MPPALTPLVVAAAAAAAAAMLPPAQLPADVDPVLVGIIAVLLLIVFMFFLLVRRTLKSFTEGMREGRQR